SWSSRTRREERCKKSNVVPSARHAGEKPSCTNLHCEARFAWFRRECIAVLRPLREQRAEASASRPRQRNADLSHPGDVLVALEGEILPLPIGQRRGARRELQIEHTADHDGV